MIGSGKITPSSIFPQTRGKGRDDEGACDSKLENGLKSWEVGMVLMFESLNLKPTRNVLESLFFRCPIREKPKNQKGHRRLSVFRLDALTGSLLTLTKVADNPEFVTFARESL